MKVTWLGQAGLLFEKGGVSIMVDPYLSDSVAKVNPASARRVPVDERFLAVSPDVMIFTHDHLDHYDPETAPLFLHKQEKRMTVLSPSSVWKKARLEGCGHNYVQFNRGTEWTEYGLRFSAVRAEHSDDCAIGVIIEDPDENKTYYITGDTLYHRDIFGELPEKIDVVFLPVNGVGNNMNMTDADAFAKKIGVTTVVPMHVGMFDELDPADFPLENKVVPHIYRQIDL